MPIFVSRQSVTIKNKFFEPIIKRVRSFKHYSSEIFVAELRKVNWSPVFLATHVDESLNQFVSLISGVIDNIAPFREIKVKQNTEPWFNADILACIRRRDSVFRCVLASL